MATARNFESDGAPARLLAAELGEVGVDRFTASDHRPGVVRHIVLFALSDAVTREGAAEISRRFHELGTTERGGKPYIVSIESGSQSSGETGANSLELGFIVTFASLGDRNFYVGTPVVTDPEHFDPAHDAFKAWVGPQLARVEVFDFVS